MILFEDGKLLYGGDLKVDFVQSSFRVDPTNGRLYHPAPVCSIFHWFLWHLERPLYVVFKMNLKVFPSHSVCCQIGLYGLVRADVAFSLSDAGLEADDTGFTLQYAGQRARVPLFNAEELHAMSAMRQRSRGGFLVA